MGRKRKWLLYSCICWIVLNSCFYGKTFIRGITLWASELEEVENEKYSLEEKKKQMEKKLAELEKEKDNIITYIEKLDQQFLELTDEIFEIENAIHLVEISISETRVSLELAKQSEENQYVTMKKSIKYMYENGNSDYFEILAQSKNISDFLNRTEYITKLSKYNKERWDRYRLVKEEVEEKESTLLSELEQLNLLEQELLLEQEALEMLIEDKRIELAKYDDDISNSGVMMTQFQEAINEQELLIEELLEKERKRVEEEEKRLEELESNLPTIVPSNEVTSIPTMTPSNEATNIPTIAPSNEATSIPTIAPSNEATSIPTIAPSNEATSIPTMAPSNEATSIPTSEPTNSKEPQEKPDGTIQFRWPLQVSGVITSYFGGRDAPTEGASSNHKGVDIGVASGTPIIAAADGKVVTATYQAAAGNYIMIYHGNSTYTVYMHCSKLSASVNQEVKQGDIIAYVGSTGVSTGPHLHFGISINGVYVDPLNYVKN